MAAKRIESELNASLSQLIPVVYGAVLGFSFYVFAQLIIDFWKPYAAGGTITSEHVSFFCLRLALYFVFTFYVVQDIGEIVKLAAKYPFRRSSRYSHEVIIASGFLASFAFLQAGSYLAIVAFGLSVFWSGLWCNQLKEEYIEEIRLARLMKMLRNFQYLGGGLILLEASAFLVMHRQLTLTWRPTICFLGTFAVWIVAYEYVPPLKHKALGREVLLNPLLPDSFLVDEEQ